MTTLAQRLRLYGGGMIHFKLRQAGKLVNYRDAERLHRLEQRHVSQRRRKKIPLSDRHSRSAAELRTKSGRWTSSSLE